MAELAMRSKVDQRESDKLKARTAEGLERIRNAAERIRRMTRIYQERLDGNRHD